MKFKSGIAKIAYLGLKMKMKKKKKRLMKRNLKIIRMIKTI